MNYSAEIARYSQQIDAYRSETLKIDDEMEALELVASPAMLQLVRTDKKMFAQGFVRQRSRYVNATTGHVVRYNKITTTETLPRWSSLFDSVVAKNAADIESNYERYVRNADRKRELKEQRRALIVQSQALTKVQTGLKEALKQARLAEVINCLFESPAQYALMVEQYYLPSFRNGEVIKEIVEQTSKYLSQYGYVHMPEHQPPYDRHRPVTFASYWDQNKETAYRSVISPSRSEFAKLLIDTV